MAIADALMRLTAGPDPVEDQGLVVKKLEKGRNKHNT